MAGELNAGQIGDASLTVSDLADGALAASAAGRLKMADGYFTAAEVTNAAGGKFATGAFAASAGSRALIAAGFFDATTVDSVVATGAIGEDRLTAGELNGRIAANVALKTAGALANADHGLPMILMLNCPAGVSANLDFTGAPFKFRVIDCWAWKVTTSADAGDGVALQTAAGVAITNTLALNVVDGNIVRATNIATATRDVAAAGTLRVRRTQSTDAGCEVFVKIVRVA